MRKRRRFGAVRQSVLCLPDSGGGKTDPDDLDSDSEETSGGGSGQEDGEGREGGIGQAFVRAQIGRELSGQRTVADIFTISLIEYVIELAFVADATIPLVRRPAARACVRSLAACVRAFFGRLVRS